jgi:hypothetical protein
LAICLAVYLFIVSAKAAEVSILGMDVNKDSPICTVSLTGIIETGDADKLESQLKILDHQLSSSGISPFPGGRKLCLNSQGGSFKEALKIASKVVDEGITTVVPAETSCLSSCAVVFMAGGYLGAENSYFSNRFLHVSGVLTFQISYPEKSSDRDSYAAAINDVRNLIRLGKEHGRDAAILPVWLITEMLGSPQGKTVPIKTINEAMRAQIKLIGIAQPKTISTNMLCNACFNFFSK